MAEAAEQAAKQAAAEAKAEKEVVKAKAAEQAKANVNSYGDDFWPDESSSDKEDAASDCSVDDAGSDEEQAEAASGEEVGGEAEAEAVTEEAGGEAEAAAGAVGGKKARNRKLDVVELVPNDEQPVRSATPAAAAGAVGGKKAHKRKLDVVELVPNDKQPVRSATHPHPRHPRSHAHEALPKSWGSPPGVVTLGLRHPPTSTRAPKAPPDRSPSNLRPRAIVYRRPMAGAGRAR